MWEILSDPNHLRAYALMDSLVFGSFTVLPFLAAAMVSNAGIDEAHLMWLYVLGGACALVSSPIVGRLSDKLGTLPVFRVMAVLSTLPLIALTNLSHVPLWVAMLVMASLMVCNSGRTVPAMAMITASVEPRRRGGFMSVNAALQHLSIALATLVAGMMVSQDHHGSPLKGFRTVGLLAVATTLLSLPLAGRLRVAKGGLDAIPEPGLD
jgi:predicted MFS family arabinose efflux permease